MLTSSDLPLPESLCNLIENGFWPVDEAQANLQNLKPLVSLDKVRVIAPEAHYIFLYPPPFHTVSYCKEHGEEFWDWPMAASHEIDADLTLLIGDFGLGSDAPIALDYRQDKANPSVVGLKYLPQGKNWGEVRTHWVEIAHTFDDFARTVLE